MIMQSVLFVLQGRITPTPEAETPFSRLFGLAKNKNVAHSQGFLVFKSEQLTIFPVHHILLI